MRAPRAGRRNLALPRATYRLQLHADFTFADATALVPYLADLGVSHVYCSPYLRARAGSRHGYDIVDHASLNPELGGEEAFRRFVATLAQHGMTHLCDVVPNHMSVIGADNAWWMDVLEHGRASRYADFFDIDWDRIDPDMAGRILLPVLGEPYGEALACGRLALAFAADRGVFTVHYAEHCFPIDSADYGALLEGALAACKRELAQPVADDLCALATGFRTLPPRDDSNPDHVAARCRDAPSLERLLAQRVAENPPLAAAIANLVAAYNGAGGAEFDALHALLDRQAYRLAYWRVASDEINYRRFFDVNALAALRMENEAAFDATHGLWT